MANLISQYKLNDNLATTVVLDSHGSNNGALVGGDNTADISVAGKINTALHFDGSADYINVPYDVSLFADEMTISFWEKSDKTDYTSQGWLVSMWDYSTNKRMWGISVNSTNDEWTIATSSDGTINASVSTGIAVDLSWHYFTFVVNNATKAWKVYLDSVYQSTITADYTYINKNSFMTIGGLAGITFFDGIIDDLRIYDYQLEQFQIDALYNSGNGTENTTPWFEYYTGNLIVNITPTSTYKGGSTLYTGNIPIIITPISTYKGGSVFYTGNIPIIITPSYSIRETLDANYCSRILWYNPLIIICDTDPVKVIRIDFSSERIPSQTLYTLNASGETVKNAKDIVINNTFSQIYIACADGQVMKIRLSDFNDRTQINTGDTNDLLNITSLDDWKYTYVGTDDSNGEIIKIDESEITQINSKFNFIKENVTKINSYLNTINAEVINSKFTFLKDQTAQIKSDFRFTPYDYDDITPITREDFHVYVDDVELTDVDLSNIRIIKSDGQKTSANFSVARQFDNVDKTLADVSSELSNQNEVKIYIKTELMFTGDIKDIKRASDEKVDVWAEGEESQEDNNYVTLNSQILNQQLHIYDIISYDVDVYNPVIDVDDENPEIYKGVKIDLGTQIEEQVTHNNHPIALPLTDYNNGELTLKQNWNYFWIASAENYITDESFFLEYIGTGLSPLDNDLWNVTNLSPQSQRIYDNKETELGYYTLGSAPYLIISSNKNGKYLPQYIWYDEEDGWWSKYLGGYDYSGYVQKVGEVEYEKMKNINGNILPITTVNMDLRIDTFLYYKMFLNTRINIVNTIETDIYNNNNGFPVSIKSIEINSNDMIIHLNCDNKLSKS